MKPSSLFTAIFFISLSVWLISIDGKKGSKTGGSKKGSNVNGCLEYETDCTDRMTSAKGSNPSVPYQIWCKAESKEKCLPKAPKSHSIDYEKGRCSFCSLVHPSPPPLLHGHLRSPGCFHSVCPLSLTGHVYGIWGSHKLLNITSSLRCPSGLFDLKKTTKKHTLLK